MDHANNAEVADILFEEIKNVIYHPEIPVDVDALPETFHKVSLGMEQLRVFLLENQLFGEAMARGDINVTTPGVENVIAAPLKEVQGNLRHITWLTQQIAKGDYNQELSYMAEFSHAFNSMILELQNRQDRMQRMIERDHLTGLYNRQYIMWYLGMLEDQKKSFSLAFADLDGLKKCNDTYGHEAGDFYIQAAASAMVQNMKECSTLGRIGGDEFLIVSEISGEETLSSLLERSRTALLRIGRASDRYPDCPFRFSFGCSTMDYEKYDVNSLIQLVDQKMYEDKTSNHYQRA